MEGCAGYVVRGHITLGGEIHPGEALWYDTPNSCWPLANVHAVCRATLVWYPFYHVTPWWHQCSMRKQ